MAIVAQVTACTASEAMRNRHSTTGGNVTPAVADGAGDAVEHELRDVVHARAARCTR